jgi:RNA polymerase sigma factor (sigma-70 family)
MIMDAASSFQPVVLADVEAAQRGDPTAFTRLVESTCVLVSSIAVAIARDPDVSRDIAQDVFLSAWHDIRKLREPSSFLPWLRQITRNRARHILRTSRRRRSRIGENEASELLEAVVDPRPDADQQLIAEERRRAVAETIDLLPEDTREVVTLFYREGQSVAQVAALLDLSEAAVRQRLSRARLRLRDELIHRLGRDLVSTAPGSAFVAGVAAAVAVGAPAVASAATMGAAGAKSLGPLAKMAVLLWGTALGAAGGIVGITLGLRHLERTPYDDEERRALGGLKLVAILTAVGGALGIRAGLYVTHSAVGPSVAYAVFIASLLVIYEVWLPRILRRRHDAEMRADPIPARRRRRRERILKMIGWTVGTLSGGIGLALGLRAAGLL